MYFDGTGDYLTLPASTNWRFGTGDFTVEAWVYFGASPTGVSKIIAESWASNVGWEFYYTGTVNKFSWYKNAARVIDSTTTPVAGQWYHFAVSRASGTIRLFINGALESSASDTYDYQPTTPLTIGRELVTGSSLDFTGYIDDLRITKYSRYTANFVPPSAALGLR